MMLAMTTPATTEAVLYPEHLRVLAFQVVLVAQVSQVVAFLHEVQLVVQLAQTLLLRYQAPLQVPQVALSLHEAQLAMQAVQLVV